MTIPNPFPISKSKFKSQTLFSNSIPTYLLYPFNFATHNRATQLQHFSSLIASFLFHSHIWSQKNRLSLCSLDIWCSYNILFEDIHLSYCDLEFIWQHSYKVEAYSRINSIVHWFGISKTLSLVLFCFFITCCYFSKLAIEKLVSKCPIIFILLNLENLVHLSMIEHWVLKFSPIELIKLNVHLCIMISIIMTV